MTWQEKIYGTQSVCGYAPFDYVLSKEVGNSLTAGAPARPPTRAAQWMLLELELPLHQVKLPNVLVLQKAKR